MAIPTRKKLAAFLEEVKTPVDFKKDISYETYGKETFAYINAKTPATRARLIKLFEEQQWQVNHNYGTQPGYPVIELRVRFFRAFGWDQSYTLLINERTS